MALWTVLYFFWKNHFEGCNYRADARQIPAHSPREALREQRSHNTDASDRDVEFPFSNFKVDVMAEWSCLNVRFFFFRSEWGLQYA